MSAATCSAALAAQGRPTGRRRARSRPCLGRGAGRRTSAGSASTRPTACRPTDAYVRVAVGLDYLGAAPVRGTRYGGSGETLTVKVDRPRTARGGTDECRPGIFAIASRAGWPDSRRSRNRGEARGQMTYCVGILVREGLVMIADTRTNAGVDNIATFRKLHLFETPGERAIGVRHRRQSRGQPVGPDRMVTEGFRNPETRRDRAAASSVPTHVRRRPVRRPRHPRGPPHRRPVARSRASRGAFDVTMLLGGQVKGGRLRLFMIYSAGNFIEATADTPYLQIGEHKYGKPILDRSVTDATSLDEALKLGLISMDSTIRSNLGVGLPIDVADHPPRRLQGRPHLPHRRRPSPISTTCARRWSAALRAAHQAIPLPPYPPR